MSRPPRPDKRQTWDPFKPLPAELEAIKQALIASNLKAAVPKPQPV